MQLGKNNAKGAINSLNVTKEKWTRAGQPIPIKIWVG
jgi:hypothetical protein